MAYIENVPPNQSRTREHRFGKTIEVYTEDETTTRRLEERDHQVTERSQVQKEIKKQMNARLDVEAKITGGTYTINSDASVSRDVAQREAREQFREMVTKAKESIETETRSLRARRVTTETSETNTHQLAGGNDGVVAKFFHVSERKCGQVFSHGTHLMLDILLPSPAFRYIELQRRKAEKAFKIVKPRKPSVSPATIKPEWFDAYVTQYELADAPQPPKPAPKGEKVATYEGNIGTSETVSVPSGYIASGMEHVESDIDGRNRYIDFHFAGRYLRRWKPQKTNAGDINSVSISAESSSEGVFSGTGKSKSYLKVKITFKPASVDIGPWQKEMYDLIMSGYKQRLQAYEDALAEHKMRFQEEAKRMHPFTAEEHMRTQVKQSVIWMLCDKFEDEGAVNLRAEDGCGYPEINRRNATEVTKRWHFFDRVCEWEQMEVMFYDYFRNPPCKWVDTFDPDEPNFLFKTFLRAGYCRVQIPVARAMDFDMLTYLKTGKTWGGSGEPPSDANDPRYEAVVQELKHSHQCYQNDRPGIITVTPALGGSNAPITDTDGNIIASNKVILSIPPTETDPRNWPYHDPVTGVAVDQPVIDLDVDREIFIAGIPYRVVAINSPSAPSQGPWEVTLDRPFEGFVYVSPGDSQSDEKQYRHAFGARFVGDKFFFDIPIDAIWMGDRFKPDGMVNHCLPKFPIECD